jgi:hypothetical protein
MTESDTFVFVLHGGGSKFEPRFSSTSVPIYDLGKFKKGGLFKFIIYLVSDKLNCTISVLNI